MFILGKSVAAQLLVLVLLLMTYTDEVVRAACDVCQSGNMVACHNESIFSMCVDGVPTHNNIACPRDFVCTDMPIICYPRRLAKPSCTPQSDSPTTSITTPESTVVDDTTPTTTEIQTSSDQTATTATKPSCGRAEDSDSAWRTSTTPASAVKLRDPEIICRQMARNGVYSFDEDGTCTSFVVCYYMDEWRGVPKSCPTGQYFHPERARCQDEKPVGCS